MTEYCVVPTGPLSENCYILAREGKAWIIDPGADPESIEAEISSRGLTPVAIVMTHGHFDHLGALDKLLTHWPALPVVMRPEEPDWAFTHPSNQYPPFYFHQKRPANLITDIGDTYTCGGITARLIPTPGHTPGGQCVLIEEDVPSPLCFTGDTLFAGSIGRTDLPGGSFGDLNASLSKLKATLAPETTVLPGHGPASTMERECRVNPYLQDDRMDF